MDAFGEHAVDQLQNARQNGHLPGCACVTKRSEGRLRLKNDAVELLHVDSSP